MPEETAASAETIENAGNEQETTGEFAAEPIANTDAETPEQTVAAEPEAAEPEPEEEISYHAVEKEGSVTAIWEMQGRKHIRTIDPRSAEGKQILALFETAG